VLDCGVQGFLNSNLKIIKFRFIEVSRLCDGRVSA
jgi:hypothetical protein